MTEPFDSWWLHAKVSRADTHVYWAADSVASHRRGKKTVEPFFDATVTDLSVFLDLIRRQVVGTAERVLGDEPFFHESSWQAIEEQCAHRTRDVDGVEPAHAWYQVTVQAVGEKRIAFDWTAYGYKYAWRGVTIDKDVFYELCDRLEARIRFATEWAAIDEAAAELGRVLGSSAFLKPRGRQLRGLLKRLRKADAVTYESAASDALRCLEGALRLSAEVSGWRGRKDNLPNLIQLLSKNASVRDEDLQVLRFTKHVRDYLEHGHQPGLHMAKMSLVLAIQSLIRVATILD